MLLVILLSYFSGIMIHRLLNAPGAAPRKMSLRSKKAGAMLVLVLTVCMDLGILGWFKYSTFIVNQLNIHLHTDLPLPLVALPIGLGMMFGFHFEERKFGSSRIWQGAYMIGISAIFILSLSFISNNAYSPFIYFNF